MNNDPLLDKYDWGTWAGKKRILAVYQKALNEHRIHRLCWWPVISEYGNEDGSINVRRIRDEIADGTISRHRRIGSLKIAHLIEAVDWCCDGWRNNASVIMRTGIITTKYPFRFCPWCGGKRR